MSKSSKITSSSLLGFFLALGFIVSSFIIGEAAKNATAFNQIIKVRGVAEKVIESDRVNWSISVIHEDKELSEAYDQVSDNVKKTLAYLSDRGILEKDIELSGYTQNRLTKSVTLDKLGNYEDQFIGYSVSRMIYINKYKNLDLIETLNANFTEDAFRKGIKAQSNSPYFYYSKKVTDIKPELLRSASDNAYQRASIIADSSHTKLGNLRASRQGAFEGFDHSGYVGGYSRTHRISSLVTVDYSLKN